MALPSYGSAFAGISNSRKKKDVYTNVLLTWMEASGNSSVENFLKIAKEVKAAATVF